MSDSFRNHNTQDTEVTTPQWPADPKSILVDFVDGFPGVMSIRAISRVMDRCEFSVKQAEALLQECIGENKIRAVFEHNSRFLYTVK